MNYKQGAFTVKRMQNSGWAISYRAKAINYKFLTQLELECARGERNRKGTSNSTPYSPLLPWPDVTAVGAQNIIAAAPSLLKIINDCRNPSCH